MDAAIIDPGHAAAMQRLFDAIAQAPWLHDYFATLRRIDALSAEAPRLGKALRPSAEAVRLGQDAELDFAPAAIMSFTPSSGRAEGGATTNADVNENASANATTNGNGNAKGNAKVQARPPRIGVRFFGLFGPMGPLPLHLTEYARDRQRNHGDPTLVRFADLFHHRALLLFYRAWAQSQPAVQADRASDDRYAAWVGASFGLAPAALRDADSVPDAAKRYRAGQLSRTARQPEAIRKVLRDYFGVPVEIESYVGHWMPLRTEDRSRLGSRSARHATALGTNAVAGSKVWDRQYKLRVHLGPLSLAQYRAFLPGRRSLIELRDWMRQLLGFEMLWDVRLVLRTDEVPALRLGRDGIEQGADRNDGQALGLSTWLGTRQRTQRSDLRLTPARIEARPRMHASKEGDIDG